VLRCASARAGTQAIAARHSVVVMRFIVFDPFVAAVADSL
jgi:hypothetical protein